MFPRTIQRVTLNCSSLPASGALLKRSLHLRIFRYPRSRQLNLALRESWRQSSKALQVGSVILQAVCRGSESLFLQKRRTRSYSIAGLRCFFEITSCTTTGEGVAVRCITIHSAWFGCTSNCTPQKGACVLMFSSEGGADE